MPVSSGWPLQNGAIRFFVPHFVVRHLAEHPLSQDLYIHGAGFYPQARDHRMQRSEHEDHLLIYCTAGRGHLHAHGQHLPVTKGDLILLPAGLPHAYAADEQSPWSIYWVHFSGRLASHFVDHLALPPATCRVPVGLHPRLLADFDTLLGVRDTGYRLNAFIHASQVLKQSLCYLALLTGPHVHQAGQALNLDAIQAVMEENLHGALDLDTLAARAHLSKYHFCKRYKALTGYSPIQHFIHRKIERACYLLDVSSRSVNDVAMTLGYEDAHYFSRQFRQITGLSPRQYRQLQRG